MGEFQRVSTGDHAEGGRRVHPLQISMDQTIGVEVVEATRDAKQLNIGDEDQPRYYNETDKLTRLMRSISSLVLT